ncbi:MAG: hypothetical protein COT14_03975 [Candidatus Diapherotrites archaeon CG08_land_8_20_14_0_20_30_16]|nr:MAG: hypothetical protein COT14_03975 [Candidatus Diapherotrites archaeon CG08_land_8_20_14_0_20_30_16]
MFSKKGQGTTEYLIILAVIIVIALVVAGVMGWFPGMSAGINETQSKAYWGATSPISLSDWKLASTGATFTLKNMGADKLTVTEINVNNIDLNLTDVVLTAGATSPTANAAGFTCTAGQSFSYDVVITYDVDGGLTGKKLTGSKPIVGTCQ